MQHERRGRKAEGLERGDLLALRRHLAAERDIEQEGGDPEKDDGNGDRHHHLLIELVLEKPVGRLVSPLDGADRAIRLEQAVEIGNDRLGIGPRRQRDDKIVEGAFHIEGGFGGAAVDPKHRKKAVIGNRQARLHRVDIFRRQRDTGDIEALQPAVEDDADAAARRHVVGVGEGFVDRGAMAIVRSGRRASPQVQARERLIAGMAERNHARRNRQLGRGPVDDDVANDARFDGCDSGNRRQPRDDRQRRALQGYEDLRETRAVIKTVAAGLQRIECRYRRDEDGHARRHHQRDADHLTAQGRDVAPQFAVEQAHQRSSSGESRRALRSSPTMRPPPRRRTRSAIPAIAALCVMMTVVVPSRSLTRAIAASTTLPVS